MALSISKDHDNWAVDQSEVELQRLLWLNSLIRNRQVLTQYIMNAQLPIILSISYNTKIILNIQSHQASDSRQSLVTMLTKQLHVGQFSGPCTMWDQ